MAGAEGRGGGQHQLLLDEAGFGMILRELQQPLLQSAADQIQTLRRLAQTTLSLHKALNSHQRVFLCFYFFSVFVFSHKNVLILRGKFKS